MEFDDMPEPFEDDLEESERNQVAADREHEEFELDEETPLGHAIEEGGELLDETSSCCTTAARWRPHLERQCLAHTQAGRSLAARAARRRPLLRPECPPRIEPLRLER